MSIWSTFKTIKTHDVDHSAANPDVCGCGDNSEVFLSSAWTGFPLRLSITNNHEEADTALTRDQARELARELLAWADQDERQEASTS